MSVPSVSVVLPVHNRDAYLREAIGSITAQSLTDFELLIVDDASTNPVVKEIISDAERNDGRIRVISHQRNGGLSVARNTGIAEARAPLIALMDDDDISLSDRLLIQREYLSCYSNIVAAGTRFIRINDQGRRRWFRQTSAVSRITNEGLSAQEMSLGLAQDLNIDPTSMVRKKALLEVGGYREFFRRAQDIDLTYRMMERMSIARLADRLYLYRTHRDKWLRASVELVSWDYHAAAVFSLWCRRTGIPDPVEDGVGLPEILGRLSELDGFFRRHLIWRTRGVMRHQIQTNNLERFVEVREKIRALVQDDDDNRMYARLLGKSAYWALLYCRPRFWKEVKSNGII